MKDLGQLHHFLGIEVTNTTDGLHLSQSHYALTILEKAQMVDCKPMNTPLETKVQVSSEAEPLDDPSYFRGLVGALQYLTLTRPDLSYSVNYTSQFMHAPTVAHLKLVRRILRYVKGTINTGLHFTSHTTLDLCAFSDADWAGCPTTRRSTTGYCTFLGKNLVSWCAKKQHTISRSSTEAEYRAMANTAAELTWLSFLLADLRIPLASPPLLYCDNLSALHMTINPVFHARSKHIELDYHFVRERVALGLLVTHHIPSTEQVADLFTKPMSKSALAYFRAKLCLQPRHSLREGINTPHPRREEKCSRDEECNPCSPCITNQECNSNKESNPCNPNEEVKSQGYQHSLCRDENRKQNQREQSQQLNIGSQASCYNIERATVTSTQNGNLNN